MHNKCFGQIQRRRSIRLKGYDYSQAGWYFVTICTHHREMLFGNVVDGKMVLNTFGEIVETIWNKIPNRYANTNLDAYIIMPNHIHGIIQIVDESNTVGAIHESPLHESPLHELSQHESPLHESTLHKLSPPQRDPIVNRRNMLLSKIIGYFKMNASKQINVIRQLPDIPVWQRNYYEHIIRNEDELNRIRTYIINNPAQWEDDKYYRLNQIL